MRPQGKAEVLEAVVIAALSAVVVGLVETGFKVWDERTKPKKRGKGKKK